jgi:hypothetical protein
MRRLLAALVLLAFLGAARPAHAYNHTLKVIGIVSTLVGAGLFVTGIICIGAYYGVNNPPGDLRNAGIGLTVLGALGLGAGIPMWIIGNSQGGGNRAMLVPAVNGFTVHF